MECIDNFVDPRDIEDPKLVIYYYMFKLIFEHKFISDELKKFGMINENGFISNHQYFTFKVNKNDLGSIAVYDYFDSLLLGYITIKYTEINILMGLDVFPFHLTDDTIYFERDNIVSVSSHIK